MEHCSQAITSTFKPIQIGETIDSSTRWWRKRSKTLLWLYRLYVLLVCITCSGSLGRSMPMSFSSIEACECSTFFESYQTHPTESYLCGGVVLFVFANILICSVKFIHEHEHELQRTLGVWWKYGIVTKSTLLPVVCFELFERTYLSVRIWSTAIESFTKDICDL